MNNRSEIVIRKSRFITTIGYVSTVDMAKEFIASIRSDMIAANHHVYAFRIGYGNTVVEGMSDDGEPSGTSGPPTLAVLRGSGIGDIVCVTTRYFGGVKLGTGGLVKAYTQAVQACLETLETEFLIPKKILKIHLPYRLYDIVKHHLLNYEHSILNENFSEEIEIILEIQEEDDTHFQSSLIDKTSAQVRIIDQTS